MDEHNDGLLLFSKKMAARFLEISGVEIQKLAEKAVNKNKFKTSKMWMDVWKLWAENKSQYPKVSIRKLIQIDSRTVTLIV